MKKFYLLMLPLLLASCANTVEVDKTATYKCGDKVVNVQYLEDETLIATIDGNTNVLSLVVSASGEKYENVATGVIFWNKGGDNYLEIAGRGYPNCKEIIK